jgi:hypothetical protein
MLEGKLDADTNGKSGRAAAAEVEIDHQRIGRLSI